MALAWRLGRAGKECAMTRNVSRPVPTEGAGRRMEKLTAAAMSWLAHPRLAIRLAAIGMLLAAPSLLIGVLADDHFIRMGVLGYPGAPGLGTSRLDCFSFCDGIPEHNHARIDYCLVPWWTPDRANLSFFRPLSALTHYIDFRFLEPAWWVMHLHSLLWYGILCAVAALLYRRMLPTPWVAGLAGLLYAVDDAHGIPAGWLSNRNALLTTLFGVLVLIAHDAGRRKAWRPGILLATLSLIAGLTCGEATISVGGYLLAYMLFLDKGSIKERILSLVPYAVVVLVYLTYYRMHGYGTGGSGLYRDPFSHPGAYLLAVLMYLPSLLHAQVGLIPANIYALLSPFWQFVHSAVGMAASAVFFLLILPLLRRDPLARFLAAGMVLASLPVCSTLPGERLLCFTGLGAMALIALFIEEAAKCWNSPQKSWRRTVDKSAVAFFLVAHAVIAPLSMPFSSISTSFFGNAFEQGISRLPSDPGVASKSIVMIRAPVDVFPTSVRPIRLTRGQTIPLHVWALATGPGAVKATRGDPYTLDVWNEGGFFSFPYGTTFRGSQDPFEVGEVLRVDGFTATVLSITDDRRPQVIRFRFDVPLEDPSLVWYATGLERTEPCPPPTAGREVYLAHADPLKWLLAKGP